MPQEGICLKGGYSVKTRFTIVGYGWRAQFYLRAARMIPQEFEVTSIVTRSGERAAQIRKETGIPAVRSLEEALGDQPDFVLLCVTRAVMKDWIVRLMEQKIPVLCETPPGKDVDELNELWKEKVRLGGNVQVTEQYFLQPYYAAMIRLARSGLLGDISNMNMSAIHGYHAVSIFRKVLGVGFENCEILGRRFRFPVTETRDRGGWHYGGRMLCPDRDRVDLVFESGRTAFFDFSQEQYFSPIRSRTWNVQGSRGEIRDMDVYWLNEKNQVIREHMRREDDGVYNIDGWSHLWITLSGERIYENPFPQARLNDDELAVADVLRHMGRSVREGVDFYPLSEGLQDAYLDFCMEEALRTGNAVRTEAQSWAP